MAICPLPRKGYCNMPQFIGPLGFHWGGQVHDFLVESISYPLACLNFTKVSKVDAVSCCNVVGQSDDSL